MQEKEKLVAHLQEQEKTLNQEFMEMVGESNKFKEFLVKVYRKKIKRTKQKQGVEQGMYMYNVQYTVYVCTCPSHA